MRSTTAFDDQHAPDPIISIHTRRPVVYETPEPERGGNAIGAMIILAIGFATGVALAAAVLL